MFDIEGKVGLVTGGASGIGLCYVKELLKNGIRGVAIADINEETGLKTISDIEKQYGKKAIFIKTDVTEKKQFEEALKKTVDQFGNVDILINNAGILNDAVWETEIKININGVCNGTILGLDEFIPKYKSGEEGVIINISSIAGLTHFASIPIYTATKFAVMGLTLSWGAKPHYDRTKVKVIGICPGVTMTPLITDMSGKNLGDQYENILKIETGKLPTQSPEECALSVMEVIKKAPSGTMWICEGGLPICQFILPERTSMKNNIL